MSDAAETASRIAALEARLRLLEDKEEIRALRDSYHACINDGRFGAIADLFTDDAHVKLGYLAEYRGRAQIDAGFCGMGERERFFIKQYIHSHRIAVDGDTATGTSYLQATYGRFGVSYLVAGRYDDRYRRTPDGWRFAAMVAELDYTVPAGVGWSGDERHYLDPKNLPAGLRRT
ncbi:MAG: nuclear transport factor 2 family protein [Alphaproteobacteria bacterium]|nr:nuclear transport factor 2 family protein [Alphaproteobacteria bacterium]MCB9931140.1 nuclear transport factor 2 family protein [Alphaproteobacteria bacterium]